MKSTNIPNESVSTDIYNYKKISDELALFENQCESKKKTENCRLVNRFVEHMKLLMTRTKQKTIVLYEFDEEYDRLIENNGAAVVENLAELQHKSIEVAYMSMEGIMHIISPKKTFSLFFLAIERTATANARFQRICSIK